MCNICVRTIKYHLKKIKTPKQIEMYHVQGLKTQCCYDVNSLQTNLEIQRFKIAAGFFFFFGNRQLKSEIYMKM